MPYYIHVKGSDPLATTAGSLALALPEPFATMGDAQRYLRSRDNAELQVSYVATDDERNEWRQREQSRIDDGTYRLPGWHNRSGYTARAHHYAHISRKDSTRIAYTPDDERGYRDSQVLIKPETYLETFYAEVPTYTRERWLTAHVAATADLHITSDPDEIERVYRNGPSSCMSHHAGDYSSPCHPTRVYGGPHSTVAIAYLGTLDDDERISARTLVTRDGKYFGRLYGDSQRLAELLRARGYKRAYGDDCDEEVSEEVWQDYKIAAISADDGRGGSWVMPYVDVCSHVELSNDRRSFWLGQGSTDAQITDGVVSIRDYQRCDGCNTRYDANATDEDHDRDYCYSCNVNRTTCDGCSDLIDRRRDELHAIDGRELCEHCYSDELSTCAIDGCGTTWHEAEDYTGRQRADRERDGIHELCSTHAREFRPCRACDNFAPVDAIVCPECDAPCTTAPADTQCALDLGTISALPVTADNDRVALSSFYNADNVRCLPLTGTFAGVGEATEAPYGSYWIMRCAHASDPIRTPFSNRFACNVVSNHSTRSDARHSFSLAEVEATYTTIANGYGHSHRYLLLYSHGYVNGQPESSIMRDSAMEG